MCKAKAYFRRAFLEAASPVRAQLFCQELCTIRGLWSWVDLASQREHISLNDGTRQAPSALESNTTRTNLLLDAHQNHSPVIMPCLEKLTALWISTVSNLILLVGCPRHSRVFQLPAAGGKKLEHVHHLKTCRWSNLCLHLCSSVKKWIRNNNGKWNVSALHDSVFRSEITFFFLCPLPVYNPTLRRIEGFEEVRLYTCIRIFLYGHLVRDGVERPRKAVTRAKPRWLEPPPGSAPCAMGQHPKVPATTLGCLRAAGALHLAGPRCHSGPWLPTRFVRCERLLHEQISGLLFHPPSPHVPPLSLPHAAAQASLQTSNLSV